MYIWSCRRQEITLFHFYTLSTFQSFYFLTFTWLEKLIRYFYCTSRVKDVCPFATFVNDSMRFKLCFSMDHLEQDEMT